MTSCDYDDVDEAMVAPAAEGIGTLTLAFAESAPRDNVPARGLFARSVRLTIPLPIRYIRGCLGSCTSL